MNKLLVKSRDLKKGDVIIKAIGEHTNDFSEAKFDRIVTEVTENDFTYIKFSGIAHPQFPYKVEHVGSHPWYEVHRICYL